MSVRIISRKDWILHAWAGGTTAEILLYPQGSQWMKKDFKIRLSTAICIGLDSVFTDFTGFTRFISPKTGILQMDHILSDGSERKVSLKPFEISEFQGSWKTVSHGAYSDFNLLFDDSFTGELLAIKPSDFFKLKPSEQFLAGFFCTAKAVDVILEQEDSSETLTVNDEEFLCFNGEEETKPLTVRFANVPKEGNIGFWAVVCKKGS